MGLIKAAAGAGGGVLADQWKEYFYCDAINERLGHRGGRRTGDDDRRSGQGCGSRIRAG